MEYICSKCAIMAVYKGKNLAELKNGVISPSSNLNNFSSVENE